MSHKITWDETYISMCYVAAARSHDPRTKIGAIVVGPDKTFRSMGYNGLPRGIEPTAAILETDEKYKWISHAEENAILNASRIGLPLIDCSVYVNLTPCHNCARAIIQSGIREVIVHEQGDDIYRDGAGVDKNKWSASFNVTKNMFAGANVSLRYFRYQPVTLTAFFHGQNWTFPA